ncbi:hypothetical protein Q4Q34_07090 [Flavivirga abyssicola]|uniref:hypothetical protein n=1 Tax=Flavivirga abyssicola TaxID=3063533 RepID=UPI0026DFD6CD|nr:hypothetical protein [Flavivirga sp. MEBiC07777]WVK14793.1 hypothetical protein Q4Q34_07090 [Flavivirga sp. MEBiC07777]
MKRFIIFLLAIFICPLCIVDGQIDINSKLEYLYSDILYSQGVLYNETLTDYPDELNRGYVTNGFDEHLNRLHSEVFTHKKFHKGLRLSFLDNNLYLSKKSEGRLSDSQPIFSMRFATDYIVKRDAYSLGFWINNKKLNGNGIAFINVYGAPYYLSSEKLKTVGSKAHFAGNANNPYIFEVLKVDGDYSYVLYNLSNMYDIQLKIYSVSGIPVKEFEILNLTFLDGANLDIDPYKYYKNEAEVLNSDKIGKFAVVIGDSQHQDRELHKVIAQRTGLYIISMARGGHSIKYRYENINQPNMFWFYSQELKDDVILQLKNVDYYILPLSTNDGEGGGVLSKASIQAVINSYPYYGDDPLTILSKLNLFNAMDGKTREYIFGYKQTFAAYIMQLKLVNPDANFLLSSIPISLSHMIGKLNSDGYGIWKDGWNASLAKLDKMHIYESIRNDSKDIANWFDADWVDLKNEVGLTFENAHQFCSDGTHWFPEIKKKDWFCFKSRNY